jgi:hypothetical protein
VVLRNVVKLQENANADYGALYEGQESVSTQLRTALKKVEELARIDASMQRVVETLQSAAIGVDDASDSIRDYVDTLEADPKRLDEIESRLALMSVSSVSMDLLSTTYWRSGRTFEPSSRPLRRPENVRRGWSGTWRRRARSTWPGLGR